MPPPPEAPRTEGVPAAASGVPITPGLCLLRGSRKVGKCPPVLPSPRESEGKPAPPARAGRGQRCLPVRRSSVWAEPGRQGRAAAVHAAGGEAALPGGVQTRQQEEEEEETGGRQWGNAEGNWGRRESRGTGVHGGGGRCGWEGRRGSGCAGRGGERLLHRVQGLP